MRQAVNSCRQLLVYLSYGCPSLEWRDVEATMKDLSLTLRPQAIYSWGIYTKD